MKNPRRGGTRGASKKKVGFLLLLLLAAVNVAVIVYHGDPRKRARSVVPAAPRAESTRLRATQRRAAADVSRLPAVPWTDAAAFASFYRTDVLVDDEGELET